MFRRSFLKTCLAAVAGLFVSLPKAKARTVGVDWGRGKDVSSAKHVISFEGWTFELARDRIDDAAGNRCSLLTAQYRPADQVKYAIPFCDRPSFRIPEEHFEVVRTGLMALFAVVLSGYTEENLIRAGQRSEPLRRLVALIATGMWPTHHETGNSDPLLSVLFWAARMGRNGAGGDYWAEIRHVPA